MYLAIGEMHTELLGKSLWQTFHYERLLWVLLAIFGVALLSACCTLVLLRPRPRKRYVSESKYAHYSRSTLRKLGNLFRDRDLIDLSVVIPAYNETSRLSSMLDEALAYLKLSSQSYEIIIVDDGSVDGTAAYALEYARKHKLTDSEFRVLALVKNRGKGGAVTQGILHTRGRRVLFADADGASKFSDVAKLFDALNKAGEETVAAVAIGSRSHLVNTTAVVQRSPLRNFLMRTFHKILYVLGIGDIADTQCGFKLFSREAARLIFTQMHVEGWIFDVEVLIIAKHFGMPISEVSINWQEVQGSKINVIKDSVFMLKDLVTIRLCYMLKVWSLTGDYKQLRALYLSKEA